MVSREDSDEMARLNRIMKGERPPPTAASRTTSAGAPDPNAMIFQEGPTSEDISDMANIMKNFSASTGVKSFKSLYDNADSTVQTLVEESQNTPSLREALVTEQTNTGVIIGAWEISKHQREGVGSKPDFYYHVNNVNTGQKIKAPFLLVESARAVVKLLNNGAEFSNPNIREIAKYEIEYRSARDRALEEKRFWQRAKQKNSDFKMTLYEAKFDAAKTKALLIRERVINLYNQI